MSETTSPPVPPSSSKLPVSIKLLIGCLAVLALGFVGIALTVGVGAFALKRGVEAVAEHAQDQQEATALLDRLERDYRFQPPPTGDLTPALRRRFVAVTDQAWQDMRSWAEAARRLEARQSDRPDRRPNLGDAVTAARAAGGVVESRVVLARALAAERMSLSEYLWIGHTLLGQDREALNSNAPDGADVELVLNMAAVWGRAEGIGLPPGSGR